MILNRAEDLKPVKLCLDNIHITLHQPQVLSP